jgi:1,4-dihydroxy-6-naphthoate synthase
MRTLTVAFSPCPNDTFAFHALVHGLVDAPFAVEPVLLDIEELNRRGRTGAYDVSKLSFGVLPAIGGSYRMLRSGAALGRGVGPLVVAREPRTLADAAAGTIAIPGRDTTAFLLLQLAAPGLGDVRELRYDRILAAVADGSVDAGLIIHESRFTYADHGLVQVADLGSWWEGETGLPIPLAAICVRDDVDERLGAEVERAIRASVEYAFAHPEASRAWVREHAQELSDDVCDQHIALYVNDFSIDLGDEGLAAIDRLLQRAPAGTGNDSSGVTPR